MDKIFFEWDPNKAASNLKKHRVSFESAVKIFSDPFILTRQDRFVNGEERWQSIGMSDGQTLLLVAHTIWDEDEDGQLCEIIHIISARRADGRDRQDYEAERR